MKCLLIGSGGREHALAWKLHRDGAVRRLYIAPGNAGTASLGTNLPGAPEDWPGLVDFACRERVDLVVIGPEAPLAAGLADRFRAAGCPVFGPGRRAARLETSKVYAKEFLAAHRIPTARARPAASAAEAAAVVAGWGPAPLVIKADGLAAGKGVFVCDDESQRQAALEELFVRRTLGEAGDRVLVEEKLVGREVSLIVLSDGRGYAPFISARDHKKVGEGDRGPNTGGMGALAPAPGCDRALLAEVDRQVVAPVFAALGAAGADYRGVLYFGLMITADGPRVLEFNVRFGDPETQVLLPLLENDLFELLAAAAAGDLAGRRPRFRSGAAAGVVMAAAGYPGPVRGGAPIHGLAEAAAGPETFVFHAGTAAGPGGGVVTAGGRVLTVTGCGDTPRQARERAYAGVARVSFTGAFYRRDIGEAGRI